MTQMFDGEKKKKKTWTVGIPGVTFASSLAQCTQDLKLLQVCECTVDRDIFVVKNISLVAYNDEN